MNMTMPKFKTKCSCVYVHIIIGGESMKQKKKKLICPECGFGRLIDSEEDTKSELREESKIEAGWHPDYFAKCSKCGKQIAIRKIG